MLWSLAGAGALVATWFLARWVGRGKPCPTIWASLFDNRIVERLSGVQTLLDRADVREDMRVLDAGCGPGRLTIPLARRVGDSGAVAALDVQQGMLDRVRRNAERSGVHNIMTLLGPLERDAAVLRDQRESFDRIMLVTVLGEIPDPVGALNALRAALKPDGILSITETIIDPDYVRRRRLEELAANAGFTLERSFGTPAAFTLNFRR
jgi:ubiquinone/menaquinone biosynthesis C-methylase UbiE